MRIGPAMAGVWQGGELMMWKSLRRRWVQLCRLLSWTRTRPAYSLADLVQRITPENRVKEIDFGPPVGKELL